MPLYNLMLPLVFFVGYAAILTTPALKNGDLALLITVRNTYPAAILGLVGGAGALTAMVPAAVIVLTAGTLFAKNVVRPLFAPSMNDDSVAGLAKIMVVLISALALFVAIQSSNSLVGILLFAYNGISQLFPAVVLGLYWKRATAPGALAGILVGIGAAIFLLFSKHDPFFRLNAGFVALCLNLLVTTVVSLLTIRAPNPFEDPSTAFAAISPRTERHEA